MADEAELRLLHAQAAAHEERLRAIEKQLEKLDENVSGQLSDLRHNQRNIADALQRVKGAVPVMLSLGGIAGWALTQWDHIAELFRRGGGQ